MHGASCCSGSCHQACRSRFGMRTLQTPAVSLPQSPMSASIGWQDPPGLLPCSWTWFLPCWGEFAALLLAAETSEQEELPCPSSSRAGWLLQPFSCSSDPALTALSDCKSPAPAPFPLSPHVFVSDKSASHGDAIWSSPSVMVFAAGREAPGEA